MVEGTRRSVIEKIDGKVCVLRVSSLVNGIEGREITPFFWNFNLLDNLSKVPLFPTRMDIEQNCGFTASLAFCDTSPLAGFSTFLIVCAEMNMSSNFLPWPKQCLETKELLNFRPLYYAIILPEQLCAPKNGIRMSTKFFYLFSGHLC